MSKRLRGFWVMVAIIPWLASGNVASYYLSQEMWGKGVAWTFYSLFFLVSVLWAAAFHENTRKMARRLKLVSLCALGFLVVLAGLSLQQPFGWENLLVLLCIGNSVIWLTQIYYVRKAFESGELAPSRSQ